MHEHTRTSGAEISRYISVATYCLPSKSPGSPLCMYKHFPVGITGRCLKSNAVAKSNLSAMFEIPNGGFGTPLIRF